MSNSETCPKCNNATLVRTRAGRKKPESSFKCQSCDLQFAGSNLPSEIKCPTCGKPFEVNEEESETPDRYVLTTYLQCPKGHFQLAVAEYVE